MRPADMGVTHDGLLRHTVIRGRRRPMAMEMEVGTTVHHSMGVSDVEESSATNALYVIWHTHA